MHGIAAITGNMHRSLRYFVLLEHIVYVCMYVGWYVCPLNARALSKPYFILKLQSVRKFLRKCLLFKKQKVDSTGYYGIEDPFPHLISKLRRFMDTERLLVVKSRW